MMRLEKSQAADDDLDEILAYSRQRFGHSVGREYFFSFDHAFALLERFPESGESADDIHPGLRRLKHRQHRISYEIGDDRIIVLRVLHHAMSLKGRF